MQCLERLKFSRICKSQNFNVVFRIEKHYINEEVTFSHLMIRSIAFEKEIQYAKTEQTKIVLQIAFSKTSFN